MVCGERGEACLAIPRKHQRTLVPRYRSSEEAKSEGNLDEVEETGLDYLSSSRALTRAFNTLGTVIDLLFNV